MNFSNQILPIRSLTYLLFELKWKMSLVASLKPGYFIQLCH